VGAILRDLKLLDEEPTMLATLQRRELVEKGLGFVDKAECPLCGRDRSRPKADWQSVLKS
jgi:hypothetical protein